jgi:hypothetical protein
MGGMTELCGAVTHAVSMFLFGIAFYPFGL